MSARKAETLEALIEALMPHLRIAVVFGGAKAAPGAVLHQTQNCRPWKSYEAVAGAIAGALRAVGFRHVEVMPDDMLLGDRLRRAGTHLAWLNTGGVQGRDPMAHAPAMLELMGIPYVGHDPLNVSRLDNKHVFKRELAWLGLPGAPFLSWAPHDGALDTDGPAFRRAFGDHPGPFVVKPVSGRASLLVDVVESRAEVPAAVADVIRQTRYPAMVETFLDGREMCVAVVGGVTCRGRRIVSNEHPLAFSVVERIFPAGERIAPSIDKGAIQARLLGPEDAALLDELRALGRNLYQGFDLEFMTRVDVRLDAAGRPHVLEANPKPDLAHMPGHMSLVEMGLAAEGMDYDDLVLGLLADRLDRMRRGVDLGHPEVLALAGPSVERVVPAGESMPMVP